MSDATNRHGGDASEILRSMFAETDDLLVVDPTAGTVEELIEIATTHEGAVPSIRLLAEEGVLKGLMRDFLVASNAADLIDAGTLEMRTIEGADNTLLLTDDSVAALVFAGDSVAALADDDEAFVETARATYEARWDEAEPYALRTPAISRVRETMDAEISADAREDFEDVLASLESARGDGDGLDEVTISLLVAAKNDVLLYDISRWGEDVGIASKATFSRTKTKLEELGLIDTEKVPIDVGRPRLRLKLADERLRDATPDQLASVAQSLLAS